MNDANPWDERYAATEYVYGTAPNEFLEAQAHRLPQAADILCLSDGEGRNSTFLASLGHSVTAVDASRVGLQKMERLAQTREVRVTPVLADLADYDPGIERWDAIVSIFAHLPPELRASLVPRLHRGMRSGGLYILEHYHPKQLDYGTGGPPQASFMTSLTDLEREFSGWEILHSFEGERSVVEGTFHSGKAYVTQFIARK